MEFKHELVKSNGDISAYYHNILVPPLVVPKHWHSHLEIIYILEGKLEVEINNTIHLIEENQLVVISPKDIHLTAHKESNKGILLQIPYTFLEDNITDIHNIRFECHPYIQNSENIPFIDEIKGLLKAFSDIYDNKSLGYKLKINSLIFDLLYILVNKFSIILPKIAVQKTVRYLDRLDLITQYVDKHYMECLSLDSISAQVGLNPEYFSRFFKKYMGITFVKYLNSVRLEHFYTELNNTDSSISDLIENNGFTNYKMFMKLFKDTYGLTPSEIRKLVLENNIKNSKV